jgi:hypothetical protein
MIAAGVPQSIAMKVSGHKTNSMFLRYAISSETDLRSALKQTQECLKTVKESVIAMPPIKPPASEHTRFTHNDGRAATRKVVGD